MLAIVRRWLRRCWPRRARKLDPFRPRAGVNRDHAAEVMLPDGRVILVLPATATPAEILAGRQSDYSYMASVFRAMELRKELNAGDGASHAATLALAVEAVTTSTHAHPTEAFDLIAAHPEIAHAIAMVAAGQSILSDAGQRQRAIAAASLGLADCPLTARELGEAASFADNRGRSVPLSPCDG